MPTRLAFVLEMSDEIFAAFAEERGWVGAPQTERDSSEEDRFERTWQLADGSGTVVFVDDALLEVQFVEVEASGELEVRKAIEEEFPCYDNEQCLASLDFEQEAVTVCRALDMLACTAPNRFDQNVFNATVRALADVREEVRVAALRIVRQTEWTDFLAVVTRVSLADPSDRVRRLAAGPRMILEVLSE
ncbi:hypothetical protein [Motilibacter deserti]|uniref:HEAT repeat domain-containing protein n=1 Tax=Motilibacter deserti TaxID=2714956 RepID=A0ABX0GSD3_9ACTN|nr:hypothetical protein [Motilibacter deserti]NHC13798.1 hypothetical protein [Motilibacter deserti]